MPATLTNVIAISGGDFHSLAVQADGAVVGWGDNYNAGIVPAWVAQIVQANGGGDFSVALGVPLEIKAIEKTPAGPSLTYHGFAGKTYTFEYSDSVANAAWQSFPPILGSGFDDAFMDTNAPAGSHRFYRLRQQ